MKIDVRDNNLIVFLNKKMVSNVDFFNKSELEDYFRSLFLKLNSDYDFDMSGSYSIDVFIDKNYGVVLEIEKDDIDYFDYYDNVIDMKITISKYSDFIYKLEGNIGNLFEFCDIYLFNGDIYVDPVNIDFLNLGFLIENSEIIYGKKCLDIRHSSKKICDYIKVDKIL